MPKLFLPQSLLEEWAVDEKADLREESLHLSGVEQTYPVTGAVHFKSLASGEDEQKLLARVKTHEQLAELSAEHMTGSVLLGDTAYDVDDGYIVSVPDAPPGKGAADADLLAAFLLQKS